MDKPTPVPFSKGFLPAFTETFEYEGVWYPPLVSPQILDKLKTFEVREDDLILSTYHKSGTHCMQEILLLIQQDGHVEKIKRYVDPDINGTLSFGLPPDFKKSLPDLLATRPSPRMYITHLPAKHLPPQVRTKKPKVVYVTRDIKNACTSFYRLINANPGNESDVPWEMVFNNFISQKAFWGNWCDHALAYWERRNNGHVFFVTFEEMKKDIRSVIRRLATFLGATISPEGFERIVEHSSLEGMKRTYPKIEEEVENGKLYTRLFGLTPFIQTGVSGSWKSQFSEEQREQMDRMVKERLAGTGLDVYYP